MGRLTYAVPEDVIRITFGATLGRQGQSTIADAIDRNAILGTEDDRAYLTTLIERAESRWDRRATPMKPVPVGSDTIPEFYDAKRDSFPMTIYLDHMNIHPIDTNEGDFVEIRTGRGTGSADYDDITGQENDAWAADYGEGTIEIYRWPMAGRLPAFHTIQDRFLKISYRLSAGGDFSRAGQTTLAEDITDTDTGTTDVSDADRLPESGETVLLGGSEYAYISSADHDADTITLDERGVDLTPAASHDSGAEIHYCPSEVREAVGMIVAVRLTRVEDFSEAMLDVDIDKEAKIDGWTTEIQNTIAEYTTQSGTA